VVGADPDVVRPGRNELTEQLLADGALENVLERF